VADIKVVLADDKPSILRGLQAILDWESLGYHIAGTALDGADAWSMVRDLKPDLLITDIQMPLVDGLELSRRVRSLGWNTRVIILTGFQDFEYARTALRHGVMEFLLKPVDEVALTELLKKLALKIGEERGGVLRDVPVQAVDDQDMVRRVNLAIRSRYKENLSINELAADLFISAAYLGQVYRKKTGLSIKDTIHAVRVEAAKKVLATTSLRIYEVAELVGYVDEEYFSKKFLALVGMTPMNYRRSVPTDPLL